jgi:hypothetical protein
MSQGGSTVRRGNRLLKKIEISALYSTPALNILFGVQEEILLPVSNIMKDYKKRNSELLE